MATNYADMSGKEVKLCEETVCRLLLNVSEAASSIFNYAMLTRHEAGEREWEWEDAGRISCALASLYDACASLDLKCRGY